MAKEGALHRGATELYEDPLHRLRPRPDHDVANAKVQEGLLKEAQQRVATLWLITSVCTSFCAHMLLNGGTRTFARPEGTGSGPPSEALGNCLGDFAALLFE